MLTKRSSIGSNLSELQQLINRLFEPSLLDKDSGLSNSINNWLPNIDVKEESNQYIIHADIPGVDPKNIDVRMENGILSIKGHKETKKKEERGNYICIERSEGTFSRMLNLPNTVDSTKINAKSKNGVLEITIPKTKDSASHKIQVKEE